MTESVWQMYQRTQDSKLRDELLVRHLPLVRHVAGRLAAGLPSHIEASDLESYGLFGLLDAINRFDETRGIKFETYATTRVRGAILDGLRTQDPAPPAWRERSRRLEQAHIALEARHGRAATDEELTRHLGITAADLQQWEQEAAALVVMPLDEPRHDHDDGGKALSGHDQVQAAADERPEEVALDAERRDAVAAAIMALPERERLVITLCYYEEVTAKEVAEILGVTPSRVSQLHSKALSRLRAALAGHGLALFEAEATG